MPREIVARRLTGANGLPALAANPAGLGKYPCVVLLHERYGLVKHTEDLAQRLAGEGFAVVAPDLFHAHPDQAALHSGEISVKPSDADMLEQLEAAVALFDEIGTADPSRLAMIGVCQTGRYPFVYAAAHPIDACVALYGAAQSKDWVVNERQPHGMDGLLEKLSAPTLGIFGERDHVISITDTQNFRNALERHHRSYQITIYGDVPHGWLNDTMPGRYRPEQAAKAWDEIVSFLHATLARGADASSVFWRYTCATHTDYDFTKNVRYE